MIKLNVYYRILESDSIENHKQDDPFYFFELNEEAPYELTKEKVAEFLLIDNNIERKYIDFSSIQYKFEIQDSKAKNEYKKLVEPYPILEAIKNYNLYLKIIINKDSYSEEQEEKNEKQKEKEETQKQYAGTKQIMQWLKDIRIQIKNLNYKPIRKRKNSQHLKKNKKFLEIQNQIVDDKKDQVLISNFGKTVIIQPQQPKGIKKKVFFLYSFPLQKKGGNQGGIEILSEEDSYYKQYLSIYKIFKEKDMETNLYFKKIKENLYLDEKPTILHIRVDSVVRGDSKIKFIFCTENEEYYEYDFTHIVETLENNENIKLLIISSDNIDKIKQKMKGILPNICKIYINHKNQYVEKKFLDYEKENEFVKILYEKLLTNDCNIKGIINSLKLTKEIEIENGLKLFITKSKKENINEPLPKKYSLNYDIIKGHYLPIIGRKKSFAQCILKPSNKFCIYGENDVEMKCFLKKLGFSFYEREIVDKSYFIEIYPMEIENEKKVYQNKIDMVIDEICNNYDGDDVIKILIIIYFHGIIEDNLSELNKETKRERIPKNNNVFLKYLYSFNTDKIIGQEIDEIPEHLTNLIEYDEIEITSLIHYYIPKEYNEIMNKIFKNADISNGIYINNIYLLLNYLKKNKDKLNDDNFDEKYKNILIKNDIDKKKELMEKIINQKNRDIFIYLYIFKYGIGLSFLKFLWNDSWKNKIDYIKNNLSGIIIVEKNENEEIYRLSNSIRNIIDSPNNEKDKKNLEIFKINNSFIEIKKSQTKKNSLNDIPKSIEKVLHIYCFIFRKIIEKLDINKILDFNAGIKNHFWNTEKIQKENEIFNNKDKQFIFNEEIDSNNIHYIITTFKNNELLIKLLPYIDDISITLPTILHYNCNYIYEDLTFVFFNKFFTDIYNSYGWKSEKEKLDIEYIKSLIVRLEIFKYWSSRKIDHLNLINQKEKLEKINNETKIEICLIHLYENILKRNKKVKEIKNEFDIYIKNIKDENDRKNFEIRFKALYARNLNSIEQINNLLSNNDYKKNYETDLNIIKYQIIKFCSKFKFCFFLQNPLNKDLNDKIDINNHFFLTQKLLTILPKDFDIDFKTFKDIDEQDNSININNILFLYIANKNIYETNIKNRDKILIKILILGYNIDKDISFEEMHQKGIENIIYISSCNIIDEIKLFFDKIFFNFIHDFISILVSKKNKVTIYDAFKESRTNFKNKFKNIYNNYSKYIIPELRIDMTNQYDTFEVEIEEDESIEEISSKENLNYNYNENELEDEKSRIDNIYYMKNPFAENKEINVNKTKKRINKNQIKLPGIESLSEDNYKDFINGNIYDKNFFKDLVAEIEKRITKGGNLLNIYGNINSHIIDDLSKYFYMEKIFKDGIYIVRNINNPSELEDFINSSLFSKNPSKLILLDLTENNESIFDEELKKRIKEENKTNFIICSKKNENFEKSIDFMYKEEIVLNEKNRFIQSIINNQLIKNN